LRSIHAAARVRQASPTALVPFAGKIPDNPVGHFMVVKSLRVYPL